MNTPKLEDATVIRKLAEREGWRSEVRKRYAGTDNVVGWGRNTHLSLGHPDRLFVLGTIPDAGYLRSRDALAPILAGLSPAEMVGLIDTLEEKFNLPDAIDCTIDYGSFTIFLLTLPPRDLAYAIAEIL